MSLLLIGILCLATSIATVPLAMRLQTRSSLLFTMGSLAVIGGIVGVYCSFNIRWQPSPTIRYLGFPFPAILWQLEDGQWVGYVGSPITAVMNVVWFAAVSIVPVSVWVIFQRPWHTAVKTDKSAISHH